MVIHRGEVWWSEDPQLGPRPVLVLTRDTALAALARPLVAPLTTRVRGLPSEVSLDRDDGLPRECVVSLDNVQPLSRSVFVERITRLDAVAMRRVCRGLAAAMECD